MIHIAVLENELVHDRLEVLVHPAHIFIQEEPARINPLDEIEKGPENPEKTREPRPLFRRSQQDGLSECLHATTVVICAQAVDLIPFFLVRPPVDLLSIQRTEKIVEVGAAFFAEVGVDAEVSLDHRVVRRC